MNTMLQTNPGSNAGFADAVASSQSVFRCVMNALARPGSVQAMAETIHAPSSLMPATAAVSLALFDHDTPVWLDDRFASEPAIGEWLRFQTGAPVTRDADRAFFALMHGAATMPDFEAFALGTSEYPDRSTTLVIQVDTLTGGPELTLSGPGIRGTSALRAGALASNFVTRMQANRALFPRGVDLLLVCGDELVALPRSTQVSGKQV